MKIHKKQDSGSLRDSNRELDIEKELQNYLTVSRAEKKPKIQMITLEKPAEEKKDKLQTFPSHKLNYIPQRDTNFTPSNLLSYPNKNRAFKAIKLETLQKVSASNYDTDILNFQTSHMLKFAKSSENYDRLNNILDNLTDSNKKLAVDAFHKLRLTNDKRDKILFDYFHVDANNFTIYKDVVSLLYDIDLTWQKLLEISLKESKRLRDENVSVMKRFSDVENLNESNKKEIAYLKEYIGDNDISYKHMLRKRKLNEADIIKEECEKKERLNLIQRYQLEEE
jgi:hypothetical protein